MDGLMDGWTDGWTDGWMDEAMTEPALALMACSCIIHNR